MQRIRCRTDEGWMNMDSKTIIKEFNEYVDGFIECCTSDEQTHELLKSVAKLIEDQEERIAIMSEGGWVSVNDAMPDDYREVWVYTKGHIVDFGCHQNDYWLLNSFPSPENNRNVFVTHWQYKMIPKPPKEGET